MSARKTSVMTADWVRHLRTEVNAHVASANIASVLNDTKWRELCGAFQDLGFQYRIKDLLANEPSRWDGEWYYHPLPYFSIEWLDIDPTHRSIASKGTAARFLDAAGDWSSEIISTLARHSIPYSREGEYIRIWGYTRPSSQPKFEFGAP